MFVEFKCGERLMIILKLQGLLYWIKTNKTIESQLEKEKHLDSNS